MCTQQFLAVPAACLRVLTRKPEKRDVGRFLELYRELGGKAEREYASSILEVLAAANRKWVEKWKGEDEMGQALMEIMAPELEEAEKKGREEGKEEGRKEGKEEGRKEGIQGAADILHGLGLSSAQIKEALMERYRLTEKETAKYI